MNGILVLAIEPIRLATGDGPPASGAADWTDWILPGLGVLAVAAVLLGATAHLIARIGLDRDPGERAFRAFARKLRLKRPQRAIVRSLAAVVEAPPVALLLCRGVFVRAIGLREEAGQTDPAERSRLLELEHKVFG